jgi:hypothetical protein
VVTLRTAAVLLLVSILALVLGHSRWWLSVHSYWRLLIVVVPAIGLWFGYRWAWWGGLVIALVMTILDVGALSMFLLGGAHRDPQRVVFVRIAAGDLLLMGPALILLLLRSSRTAIH